MTDTLALPNPNIGDPSVFTTLQDLSGIEEDWFQTLQKDAWEVYKRLPMPTRRDETWRFANLNRFRNFEAYSPVLSEPQETEAVLERSHRFKDVSGRIVFIDDNAVGEIEFDPSLGEKGVIFTTLADAIIRYPELVRETFMQQSPELGSEKFEALHVSLLRNGVFLYIPDNVEVEHPFMVYNWAQRDMGALFPHTLFVTGRHAKATLIEFQEAVREDTRHMVVANAHQYAGEGAKPTHTIVQNWNLNTLSFQLNTNNAKADTQSKSTVINIGSQQARQEIHGRIFGSGSNVEMYALNVPAGSQEFDQRTLQTHIAPHSRSDLLFKNALLDKARTIFSGLIIVEEDAQQTDAYQTNNNLMLSEEAESNSLPGLEIKANDVKCSHGATTGRIDESELFYFLARGIPRLKAQQLMIFGYLEEIIGKLGNEELATYVRESMQRKFSK